MAFWIPFIRRSIAVRPAREQRIDDVSASMKAAPFPILLSLAIPQAESAVFQGREGFLASGRPKRAKIAVAFSKLEGRNTFKHYIREKIAASLLSSPSRSRKADVLVQSWSM